MVKRNYLMVMFALMFVFSVSLGSGTIYRVHNATSWMNTTGNHSDSSPLNAAINASFLASGDIVYIYSNLSYTANIEVTIENVTIWGINGSGMTIITNSTALPVINISAKNTTIIGLTISKLMGYETLPADAVAGPSVEAHADAVTIKDCTFLNGTDDMLRVGSNLKNITSGNIQNNTFQNMNNTGRSAVFVFGWNSSISGVTIQENDFINITGVAINISGNATNGTISNIVIDNNIINATMSTQGISLSNVTSVNITSNTIYNSTGNGIDVHSLYWPGQRAYAIKIDNNNLTYNQGFGIEFCGGENSNITIGAANLANIIIRNNSFIGNVVGGINNTCMGSRHTNINASYNFWGNMSGPLSPINSQGRASYTAINRWGSGNIITRGNNVSTNVTYLPFYRSTSLQKLSASTIISLNETSLNITHNDMAAILNTTLSNATVITMPLSVENASIDFSSTMNVSNVAALNAAINITTNASSSDGVVEVNFPQNMNITGNASWNGLLYLPTARLTSIISTTDLETTGYINDGYDASVATVIEIGANKNITLTMDRAIRILIQGEAGKQVAYQNETTVPTAVTTTCTSDSQTVGDALTANTGICSMDSGSDLIIWTKHLTRFITYSQVEEATTTTDDSSGGGGTSTSATVWEGTQVLTDEQFVGGYTKELGAKQRVKFKIGGKDHSVGVTELTDSTAKIEVASDAQEATLQIGDERKFEVTGDDYYDFKVILNSIENNKASVTVKSISEKVTPESEEEEEEKESAAVGAGDEVVLEEGSKLWIWIIVIIVVILILAGAGVGVKKARGGKKK